MTTLPAAAMKNGILGLLDKLQLGKEHTEARLTYQFVRGAALDSAGRHAEAWECFRAANRAIALTCEDELRSYVAREQANLVALRDMPNRTAKPDDRLPISLFILGPSRSGKTSLERLVGSLDGVKRGYENPSVDISLQRTFDAAALPRSKFLEQLPPAYLPAFRDIYHEQIARRAGSARVFTNTTPDRIHEAGLIAANIPNARFVFVTRDKDDNALRIYMKKYLRGNSYAYDLKSIYEYLDWYEQMAGLLIAKFPDAVRHVRYETIVSDPLAAAAAAADLCGIAVNDALPPVGDDRGCAEPYRALMKPTK